MLVAYYCFINLGMLPHEYDELEYRDKVLVKCFVLRDLIARNKEAKDLRG